MSSEESANKFVEVIEFFFPRKFIERKPGGIFNQHVFESYFGTHKPSKLNLIFFSARCK